MNQLAPSFLKPGVAIPPADPPSGNWSSTYRWIPIAGGFVSFALACMTGANDVPASFATSVGSGALSLPQSVALASLMEFTGAAFMGNRSVDALQSSILKVTPDAGLLMWGFMIATLAATIWLVIATYLEMPVSSTLSIQGAILGISLTTQGLDSIYWSKNNTDSGTPLHLGGVLAILLSWILAPSIAAAVGFLVFGSMKLILLRSNDAEKRTLQALPFFYGLTVLVIIFFIIYRGSPHTHLHELSLQESTVIAAASALVAIILAFLIVVPLARKRLACFKASHEQNLDAKALDSKVLKTDVKEESDHFEQKQVTAEELLQQFNELRVLDTVYEGDEEASDQSPPVMVKCSPVCGPSRIPLKQLLARTPNRFTFKRLRREEKMNTREKLWQLVLRLRASTFDHKLEYDRGTLVRHALAEKFDEKAEELFSFLQILIGCVAAFAHGSNDVASAMNPYAATINIYRHRHALSNQTAVHDWRIDIWILALGGTGVGIGFAVWGWKVVKSLGGRFSFLSPSRGFCVQLCALATILLASKTGLPLSTTHIFMGAILGVTAADSIKNINWHLAIAFLAMWFLTVVFTCGTMVAIYAFTIFSPSVVVA